MLKNDQLAEWDRQNFFHPSTHLAQHARGDAPSRIITGGEGVYIIDRDGNLRGRDDDDFVGYDARSAAEINNTMVDDVKVILAEYRLALKKYNQTRKR